MGLALDQKTLIDERIDSVIKTIENPLLREATHYAIFPGGKRLRPKMLLSISGNIGLDAAVAIELIHTYTLIHDDLPAMDNDDFRRGKPTLHKAFDEATAVLSGDLLLTLAFEVLANSPLPTLLALQLIRVLSKYIGANGIIDGQSQDITKKITSWEEYQEIAIKKTSDLFTAALICGARIQGLSESDVVTYTQFGKTFGILYQIRDDLEDQNAPLPIQSLKTMEHILTLHAKHLLTELSLPNPFLAALLSR